METYEKKYKELEGKIKKAYLYAQTDSTKAVLEEILPELAESEDEKIRKELIEHIKANKWADYVLFQKFSPDDVISWLEKQQSVEEIVARCKDSWYNEGRIDGRFEGITDDVKYQQGWHDALEKQGEKVENEIEVPFSVKDSELKEEIYYIPKGFCAKIDDDKVVIKKGKKPTAWNEEDEKNCSGIIDEIAVNKSEAPESDYDTYDRFIDWLNSLKERVQPQNNSITDEELEQAKKDAYNDALDKIEYHSGEPTFADGWHAAIDCIKKKSFKPNLQWKPSDEQMDALEHFVRSIGESGFVSPYDANLKLIHSLLNDLKKLKEE